MFSSKVIAFFSHFRYNIDTILKGGMRMKRILSFMLVLTILLAFSVPALADDPLPYTDVEGHWALRYIEQVTAAGLMNGQSFTVPGLGVVTKVRTR